MKIIGMIVNHDEEMRKALESMKDASYDYFESGCSFCGEAVEWALKTIDSQQAEIDRLKEQMFQDGYTICTKPYTPQGTMIKSVDLYCANGELKDGDEDDQFRKDH